MGKPINHAQWLARNMLCISSPNSDILLGIRIFENQRRWEKTTHHIHHQPVAHHICFQNHSSHFLEQSQSQVPLKSSDVRTGSSGVANDISFPPDRSHRENMTGHLPLRGFVTGGQHGIVTNDVGKKKNIVIWAKSSTATSHLNSRWMGVDIGSYKMSLEGDIPVGKAVPN